MIATVVVLYILKLAGFIKFPDYSLSTFHKVSWLKKKQCKSFEQWETEFWEDAAQVYFLHVVFRITWQLITFDQFHTFLESTDF